MMTGEVRKKHNNAVYKIIFVLMSGLFIIWIAAAAAATDCTLVSADDTAAVSSGTEPDFSSMRLITSGGLDEVSDNINVVSTSGAVSILQFDSEESARRAYRYFYDKVDIIEPDCAIAVADQDGMPEGEELISTGTYMTEEDNPFSRAEELDTEGDYDIALIDTGAGSADGAAGSVSVIGDDPEDDNGHGSMMMRYILSQNRDARVLSVKALDKDGKGDISAVYAAIEYAISQKVSIINLSMSAFRTDGSRIIDMIIGKAADAGITVVGAAGNNRRDIRYYVPGNIEEAVIAGTVSAGEEKTVSSNYGDTVDYYLLTRSSSCAAAIISGMISAGTDPGRTEAVFKPDEVLIPSSDIQTWLSFEGPYADDGAFYAADPDTWVEYIAWYAHDDPGGGSESNYFYYNTTGKSYAEDHHAYRFMWASEPNSYYGPYHLAYCVDPDNAQFPTFTESDVSLGDNSEKSLLIKALLMLAPGYLGYDDQDGISGISARNIGSSYITILQKGSYFSEFDDGMLKDAMFMHLALGAVYHSTGGNWTVTSGSASPYSAHASAAIRTAIKNFITRVNSKLADHSSELYRYAKGSEAYVGEPAPTSTYSSADQQNVSWVRTVILAPPETGALTLICNEHTLGWGDLRVGKSVSGTGSSTDDVFTFTVHLEDSGGAALSGVSYSYTGGGGKADGSFRTNTSGNATFTLAGSEFIIIRSIPAGTKYRITETTTGTPGRLYTPQENPVEGVIPAVNTSGSSSQVFEYTVNIRDEGENVNGLKLTATGAVSGTLTTGSGNWGAGNVKVNLRGGQSVKLDGIPVGYTYSITKKDVTNYTTVRNNGWGGHSLKMTESGRSSDWTSRYDPPQQNEVFVNSRNLGQVTVRKTLNPDSGALKVSKVLSGPASENDPRMFGFRLTLKDSGGNALTGLTLSYTGEGGAQDGTVTTNASGEASFSLAGGQSIVINGIPFGTDYTVREVSASRYAPVNDVMQGTITAPDLLKNFSFTVNLKYAAGGENVSGLNISIDKTRIDDETHVTGTRKTDSSGNIRFSLKGGENIILSGIPTGYHYTVTETQEDGYVTASSGAEANVSKNGTTAAFTNTRADGIIAEQPVVFENARLTNGFRLAVDSDASGEIRISKVVPGGSSEGFDFVLRLSGGNDEELEGTYAMTVYDADDSILSEQQASSGDHFELKDGQYAVIAGLPCGTVCRVTENENEGYSTEVYHDDPQEREASYTAECIVPFPDNETFTTKIVLMDENGTPAPGLTVYCSGTDGEREFVSLSYVTDEEGRISDIPVKAGAELFFYGIPSGYKWTSHMHTGEGYTVSPATSSLRSLSNNMIYDAFPVTMIRPADDQLRRKWTVSDDSVISSIVPAEGFEGCSGAIRVSKPANASSQDWGVLQRGIPVVRGNTYTASVWVKGTGVFNMNTGSTASGVQSGGYVGISGETSDTWTRHSMTFIAGEDCEISDDGTVSFSLGIGAGSSGDVTFAGMILEGGRGSSQIFLNTYEAVKGSSAYDAAAQEAVFVNTPSRRGGVVFVKKAEGETTENSFKTLGGALIGLYNISERDLIVTDAEGTQINAVTYREEYEELTADDEGRQLIASYFREETIPALVLQTDENGIAGTDSDNDGFDESLAAGTYIAVELTAPDGYMRNDQWYVVFYLNPQENGTVINIAELETEGEDTDNEDITGIKAFESGISAVTGQPFEAVTGLLTDSFNELKIHKTDGTSGEALSGVVFDIWTDEAGAEEVIAVDISGEAVRNNARLTTDKEGLIVLRKLRCGVNGSQRSNRIYYIREAEGPAGYISDHTIVTIMVDENGMIHGENESEGVISYSTIKKASEACAEAITRLERAKGDPDGEEYKVAELDLRKAQEAVEQLRVMEASSDGSDKSIVTDGPGYAVYELRCRNLRFRAAGLFTGGHGRGGLFSSAAGIMLLSFAAPVYVYLQIRKLRKRRLKGSGQ